MHIDWLEPKAVLLALETVAAKWTNMHVVLPLDNRTTIALTKGNPPLKTAIRSGSSALGVLSAWRRVSL